MSGLVYASLQSNFGNLILMNRANNFAFAFIHEGGIFQCPLFVEKYITNHVNKWSYVSKQTRLLHDPARNSARIWIDLPTIVSTSKSRADVMKGSLRFSFVFMLNYICKWGLAFWAFLRKIIRDVSRRFARVYLLRPYKGISYRESGQHFQRGFHHAVHDENHELMTSERARDCTRK